eukprot:TRINITY_DN1355_c0_g1_i1.p1 TRINITY_DN1355_c0_g1~~TRINITY_DN1355_c0_g1_i1.p1  ORF type:complete len:224 (+),score=54.23 TRINITY_DN1355_c0_g1_i1:55-726(+)
MSSEEKAKKNLKVILLGDTAVGKSKLVERYMMGQYIERTDSTNALAWFAYNYVKGDKTHEVEIWDTAGQERFNSMHRGYYCEAHSAILVFDVQRKPTYKHLDQWLSELRQMRPEIPVLVAANKIDLDMEVTKKEFNFSKKNNLELHYVSAATGMNVVDLFNTAIDLGLRYRDDNNKNDYTQQVLELIHELGDDKEEEKKEADATADDEQEEKEKEAAKQEASQ